MQPQRKDRYGEFRTALDKNRRIIFQTQQICGICGQPVDMDLKYPDPMSKTIDHIVPIAKGGHPSDLSNLQLAHRWCNRMKSDKLFMPGIQNTPGIKNTQGLLNNRGASNNPPHQNNQGISNNPPGLNIPGTENGPDPVNPGHEDKHQGITAVDNNNLPQHADWSTLKW